MHIWTIDGETHCATLHIVANGLDSRIKTEVKEEFKEHGISHVTVEMETPLEKCLEKSCDIRKETGHCNHRHHHH